MHPLIVGAAISVAVAFSAHAGDDSPSSRAWAALIGHDDIRPLAPENTVTIVIPPGGSMEHCTIKHMPDSTWIRSNCFMKNDAQITIPGE